MVGKRVLGFLGVLSAVAGISLAGSARAQEIVGIPHEWQMSFPPSYTTVMDKVESLHNLLLVIITLISLFVLALLIYVVFRFHVSRNPTPSTVTHNTVLEIAWTIVPILILVVIAIPSFRLLYYSDKAPDAAMTVKVTGHQWYWQYEYPDQGNFSIDSRILAEADRIKEKPQVPRLLAVDNEMVIPVNTTIRIIGTGADVMHAWTVPGFGIKKTVIPGRLNEGWINVEHEGYYFGECSQICGENHTYMPIAVRVVSKPEFDKWVAQQKKAAGLTRPTGLAAATIPVNR
ncbi:cytochrome c oxidase subunit II [Enhydrobacter sp.]|jgi:cytochrome c oxidase subunit 2|uniref:cytochrome c oxidase subunit II n=1 Tax=Enhydrobacter sp. TaxID=1894999 RepID=UPI00262AD53D|nr:cytochrome c oxidase subunit II [Enhydrobacter sp.]WIM09451.1 MAG: Cytochrome c oxidase polypeptide II [Enhydrobacter sp.]